MKKILINMTQLMEITGSDKDRVDIQVKQGTSDISSRIRDTEQAARKAGLSNDDDVNIVIPMEGVENNEVDEFQRVINLFWDEYKNDPEWIEDFLSVDGKLITNEVMDFLGDNINIDLNHKTYDILKNKFQDSIKLNERKIFNKSQINEIKLNNYMKNAVILTKSSLRKK